MPKPREEYIHILVHNQGYIAPLQMTGPVLRPIKVTKQLAKKLIMIGCNVYEYIPFSKETIKLTYENINDESRYDFIKITPPAPKPAKAPVAAPVVEAVPEKEPEPEIEETPEIPMVEVLNESNTRPVDEPPPESFIAEFTAPEVVAVDEVKVTDEVAEDTPAPTEEPISAEEAVAEPEPIDPESYEFSYNEDGTVNESVIDWTRFSGKNGRRAIRARIRAINQAAKEAAAAVTEETKPAAPVEE